MCSERYTDSVKRQPWTAVSTTSWSCYPGYQKVFFSVCAELCEVKPRKQALQSWHQRSSLSKKNPLAPSVGLSTEIEASDR